MNVISKSVLGALLLTGSVAANAAFVLTNSNGGDGFLTLPMGSSTFAIESADNGVGSNLTAYTQTFSQAAIVTFNWNYVTQDTAGSALDPAGYVLNGTKFQLTSDMLRPGVTAFGSIMLNVAAGDTFGWYVDSWDSIGGRGRLKVESTITPNVSSVPVPAAAWLFGSALLSFVGVGARRKV